MTIKETIRHCEEIAKTTKCGECGDEHQQIANWLKELLVYRETDLVKVVRCEDCKHYDTHDMEVGFCNWTKEYKNPNSYCVDGDNGSCSSSLARWR